MRDVLARDQIEYRDGALRWGDVISARGHHEQVLLDPRQVDGLAAQLQAGGSAEDLLAMADLALMGQKTEKRR